MSSTLSRRYILGGGAVSLLAATSAFADVLPKVGEASLIRLGLNENPWGPSPKVGVAVRAAISGINRYVDTDAAAFTQQIAAFEGVKPEQVLLGEVLAPLGLQLALEGGKASRFVYSAPGYAGFTDAAAAVGGQITGVALTDKGENDLPALRAAIAPDVRAVFLVNPHNPSGTVSDRASLDAFLREVSKQTLIIVDEAYLEYTDQFAERTAVRLTREGHNVVVFRTFAKAYGLAGLQIGYAIAPVEVAAGLRRKGVGAPRSLDRLSLAAASAALGDQDHIAKVRTLVAKERALWHAELDRLGWTRTQSVANFVFFKGPAPQETLAAALKQKGIDIGRAHLPLKDWTRITIGLPSENVAVRAALVKIPPP